MLLLAMNGLAITAYAETDNVGSPCNPVVKLDSSDTTLAKALQHLAEKHQFALSFPKNLDQSVQIEDAMPLDQMIRFLTRDMNTAMQHRTIAGCASPRLAELTILPTGEESEFINVAASQEDQQPVEYIYIENMDVYAEEVLLKKRRADIKQMSAEQQLAFKEARKRIKKQLQDEGRLNNRKKNNNKEKLTNEERKQKRDARKQLKDKDI